MSFQSIVLTGGGGKTIFGVLEGNGSGYSREREGRQRGGEEVK
jgi:hypothetical protein